MQMAATAGPLKPLAAVFEAEVAQKGLRQAFKEGGQKTISREIGTTKLRIGWGASYLHTEITDQARGLEVGFVGGRSVDDPFDAVGECYGDGAAIETMVRELVGNYQKANPAAPQS
jgi:hypothetical protein